MRITIWFVTYNSMNGNSLSLIGDFLLWGAPESFGAAITQFELYARIPPTGPPAMTLDFLYERFNNSLKTMPRVWFKRKKRLVEIAYITNLGSAEVLPPDGHQQTVSVQTFHDAGREIVAALAMARKRVNASDEFDFPAFYAHLERRLDELPTSDAEVATLLDHLTANQRLQP